MKTLSKEEEEIIRLIQEKKITDIYSFVKHYNLGTYVQHFKEDIQKKFDAKYGEMTFVLPREGQDSISPKDIIEELPNNQIVAKPVLVYHHRWEGSSEWESISYNPKSIKNTYCLVKPTYICENMEKILHFISVWQFLESERLVIELPKSCEKHDMGLFLRKKSLKTMQKCFPEKPSTTYDLQVSAKEFMDWHLVLEEHDFEICLPYLTRELQPTLALNVFIEKGFKTKEERNENRNFAIALIGVIVAIVTSIASLLVSFSDKGYFDELHRINNSLQQIREEIRVQETQDDSEQEVEKNEEAESEQHIIDENSTTQPQ